MTPPLPVPPRGLYGAWHRLWEAVHRRRDRRGPRRPLPRPAVSVGNLHWGGTGKTPLVAAIAAHLRDSGRRVAILSRGYGRSTRGPLLVSRGAGPVVGPWEAGDEPHLLASQLAEVAVIVAEARVDGARLAMEALEPAPDLFLLDDAFSHLAVAREVDLLVLPAADPFGGGTLPPRGRLREPLAATARAHAVVVTGRPQPGQGASVAEALRDRGFGGPGFEAPSRVGAPRSTDGDPLPSPLSALLVSGVARPERVLESAVDQGIAVVEHLAFRDHCPYRESSLRRIRDAAHDREVSWVVTTSKDLAKLRDRLPLSLAELPLESQPEAELYTWLEARLG